MNGQEAPNALLDLMQRGANYAAPNALSLLMGGEAPPLQNVPDTPGKVPSTQDPRLFGAVAEAANIGQNFIPQGGTAKLGGGMLAALIAPAARKGLMQKGIKAYHGSPHDFDRFDMSKIGTGEGAQAYGHGLYFAGNENVARQYRENLGRSRKLQGLAFNPDGTPNRAGMVAQDLDAGINEHGIRAGLRILEPNATEKQIQGWLSEGRGLFDEANKAGRMYEVNIRARPEEFLDWDRPISGQPRVLEAARFLKMPESFTDRSGNPFGITGGESYQHFAGMDPFTAGRPGASAALRDAGIPGIRYLDQGSRTAGEGTSNYVLFRDDIIDILRKYGLPATAGPLGALMMSGQEASQ